MSVEALAALNNELDHLSAALLSACEQFVQSRSRDDYRAWQEANSRYVAAHRRWWALANPDVDYDSVFGC